MDHLKFQNITMSYPNSGRFSDINNTRYATVTRPVSAVMPVQVWNHGPQVKAMYPVYAHNPVAYNVSAPDFCSNSVLGLKTRNSYAQTDFPIEIADLQLKELPNTLFLRKNNLKSSQNHHAKKNHPEQNASSHRLNVMSSGTHPCSQQPFFVTNTQQDSCSDNENRTEPSHTKKKRKRNRKKKKQSTTGFASQNEEDVVEEINRNLNDISIHLEDELEFPDLSGPKRPVVVGASNNNTKLNNNMQLVNGSSDKDNAFDLDLDIVSFDVDNENDQMLFQQAGETKNARKRRKRRDQANKAATEEMAEITIEQQMLQELGLKSKKDTQANIKEPVAPPPKPPKANKNNKKSNQPIAFDIAAMIDALKQSRDDANTTKNAPKKHVFRKKKPELEPPRKPHNPLDSTCPKVKRGKEREFAKAKKPSPLKKVILKEREEKKRLRLLDDDPTEDAGGSQVCVGVVNPESDLSQDEDRTKGCASAELSPVSQTSPFSMSPLSPSASPLQSGFNSPIAKDAANPALSKIHSRRYREYCTQILDKDIDNCCLQFLQNLVRYQDKQYHKDPKKAKAKRRIVLGLREVAKHLKLHKIKCVIISPNLEKIQSKGGLDDALNNILNMCIEQDVPYVFALGRRALGRACAKLVPVSVVGVFNFEGSDKQYWRLVELTQKATDSYKEMVSVVEKDLQENPATRVGLSNVPNLFAHMGHSRTPSGCSAISFTSSILSEPISENYPYSEPETDSKGYEVSKVGRNHMKGIQSVVINEQSSAIYETDAGNEADTEDYNEPAESPKVSYADKKGRQDVGVVDDDDDDDEDEEDDTDNIEDLPHIDSIHYVNYDLSVEILSQHSSRTIENSEAMSTHSSRTLQDGSPTTLLEKFTEKHSSQQKLVDKDRIKSWVEATQSINGDQRVDGSVASTDDENGNQAEFDINEQIDIQTLDS